MLHNNDFVKSTSLIVLFYTILFFVIIDNDINDTNVAKGEPDVTVNGKKLRMAQAVDGNWYGYFADRNMTLIADSTVTTPGTGLDYGEFCNSATILDEGDSDSSVVTFTDTIGIIVPGNVTTEESLSPSSRI